VKEIAITPARLTSPYEGAMPTMLLLLAGRDVSCGRVGVLDGRLLAGQRPGCGQEDAERRGEESLNATEHHRRILSQSHWPRGPIQDARESLTCVLLRHAAPQHR